MVKEGQQSGSIKKSGGTGANKHREQTSGEPTSAKTLADLGISRDQSSQWQKLAEIPKATISVEMLPILEAEAAERMAATLKQNAAKTPATQKVEYRTDHNDSTAAAQAAALTGTKRQVA